MGMSAKLLAIYGNECQTVSTLNKRVPTLFHFTRLKSSNPVGFSTLPWQSGDVIALYQAKVRHFGRLWHFTTVMWQRFTVVTWCCDDATAQRQASAGHGADVPGHIRADKLEAASWMELQAASWKLRTVLSELDVQFI